jgi:hypothetical protein
MPEQKSDEFSFAKGEKDGLPYFLVVRDHFSQFEYKTQYSWFLSFEIFFESNSPLRLASDEEAEILNKFEDFLNARLSGAVKIFFVARITWNSRRLIFYYISNPKSASEVLEEIMREKNYQREFQYKIEKDLKWEKMSSIIPNIRNFSN